MPKTLDDWVKEFYPIEARDVKGGNKELLEHSLKKWKGATKENTEAYNCIYGEYCIEARGIKPNMSRLVFGFEHNTCALCQVHKHTTLGYTEYDCNKCIITLSGNPPCSVRGSAYSKSGDDPSPYDSFTRKTFARNQREPVMTNLYSIWVHLYTYAIKCAGENQPTLFHSRIDGAVLPAAETYEE